MVVTSLAILSPNSYAFPKLLKRCKYAVDSKHFLPGHVISALDSNSNDAVGDAINTTEEVVAEAVEGHTGMRTVR